MLRPLNVATPATAATVRRAAQRPAAGVGADGHRHVAREARRHVADRRHARSPPRRTRCPPRAGRRLGREHQEARAAPATTLNAAVVAAVGPVAVAVERVAGARAVHAEPLNVATPATAATVAVPRRLAPAVPVPAEIASVTLPVNPVAVLPCASCAVTTTPKPAPAVARGGRLGRDTASCVAVPPVTLNGVLVAPAVSRSRSR